jgi:hypothetical protein
MGLELTNDSMRRQSRRCRHGNIDAIRKDFDVLEIHLQVIRFFVDELSQALRGFPGQTGFEAHRSPDEVVDNPLIHATKIL